MIPMGEPEQSKRTASSMPGHRRALQAIAASKKVSSSLKRVYRGKDD
jgi:hypothetical protein